MTEPLRCLHGRIDSSQCEHCQREEKLREVIRQLAKTLEWQCFGDCRAYGTDAILSPREASDLARETLYGPSVL